MTSTTHVELHTEPEAGLRLSTDVLVVGGGPAGAWAALSAAATGAAVVLVDKGYCGTSGATAPANTGVWHVSPEGDQRERAIEARWQRTGGLADKAWMAGVLDETWRQLAQLADWGYPFPIEDDGLQHRANLRGPDYMHFLRRQLKRAGVRLLDHSPALELLVGDGQVAGAAGRSRQLQQDWQVRAGAVVLASGGCAYLSKALGCDVNTGDGHLMAAEVGAELSGMEFSAQYGICPAYSTVTKGLIYAWASFSDEAGTPVLGEDRMLAVGRALLQGPVYAVIDRASPEVQRWLRAGQPNIFLPHDRRGIDPFTQRFPVTLRAEGTVRGSGGIRTLDRGGSTAVPGLYAAGDAASRERLVGASSGGGSPNAAWAISSGSWAGRAAASHALPLRATVAHRSVRAAGGIGLRPWSHPLASASPRELIDAVQAEVLPLDRNLFRHGHRLEQSLERLDTLWRESRLHLHAQGDARVRVREAAALLAHARWAYRAARARNETRGLQQRIDWPATDVRQAHSLLVDGLDEIMVRRDRPVTHASQEALAT